MAVLLLLYFHFVGVRAFALIRTGTPLAVVMGVALLVLPTIGIWALFREIQFGYRATHLHDRLAAEGALPDDLGEPNVRGKYDRERAAEVFDRYREAAEADPMLWQNWFRLGLVYDAAGDRVRARGAMRRAIECSRGRVEH